jgi:type II secretory pathway pseudopilin PulG
MKKTNRHDAGFSLLELLISVAMFVVIGGVALTLVARNEPLYNRQQNTTALNIGLRSAIAQMELDMVNGGTGYYVGANIPSWPIGVTLVNNTLATGSCFDSTTNTYGPNCFDRLNIIAVAADTPPSHPTDIGTNCVSTTSSILFADPVAPTTLSGLASYFSDGDQLLLVKADGSQMTTTILTADADVSGGKVRLQHNPTGADGTNDPLLDPLGITTNPNNKLGTEFCDDDWILKLSPISYSVDTSVPANPKLMRTQGGASGVVAEQVIGFKLGASIWNDSNGTDQYYFDASEYPNADGSGTDPYNYTLVRSVRVSLIGRTTPVTDPTYNFRNTFDNGPYQIQAVSVVVNPRNLSMKDQ